MGSIGRIDVRDGGKVLSLYVMEGRYSNGRVAFTLTSAVTGEPYARLSVNIVHAPLESDEFVLDHDLNDDGFLLVELAKSGLFAPTNKRVDYGFVVGQPVWRVVRSTK